MRFLLGDVNFVFFQGQEVHDFICIFFYLGKRETFGMNDDPFPQKLMQNSL